MFDSFGGFGGFGLFSGNSFIHDVVTHTIQASNSKRDAEHYRENKRFLDNVPQSIGPCESTNHEGRKLTFGENSAIYDDDGEMVWNSVTGCCGKAIYA